MLSGLFRRKRWRRSGLDLRAPRGGPDAPAVSAEWPAPCARSPEQEADAVAPMDREICEIEGVPEADARPAEPVPAAPAPHAGEAAAGGAGTADRMSARARDAAPVAPARSRMPPRPSPDAVPGGMPLLPSGLASDMPNLPSAVLRGAPAPEGPSRSAGASETDAKDGALSRLFGADVLAFRQD